MRKYIIKRLIISAILLVFVAFLIYVLMRSLPTSYIESLALQKSMLPNSKSYEEWLEQLSAAYGMDKEIIPGFITWAGNALRGNFGDSWHYTIPVIDKFNEVIWLSFIVGLITMFLELIISIPLGILAARKQYSRTDYAISILALSRISLPTFFFASLIKLIFCVKLGWFD
ncbi:MAG: ABC transporter permease, partial [Solobacterium sp.]|nr:ABC transporter permease [Solobacterium sp.]